MAAGRIKKVQDDSSSDLETYTYGADRQKLSMYDGLDTYYYFWANGSIMAEYIDRGSPGPRWTKSYFYAGSRLILTTSRVNSTTEKKETHHPDRLGTKIVTNVDSGAAFEQSTLPFGTAFGAESSGYSNQVFTSYDRSSTTGLDYANNRTYSSGQGRFTQVDPIGMSAATIGDPQSNNMYAYVQNMPTDFVDPSGLDGIANAVLMSQRLLQSAACRAVVGNAARSNSNLSQQLGQVYSSGRITVRATKLVARVVSGRIRSVEQPFGGAAGNTSWYTIGKQTVAYHISINQNSSPYNLGPNDTVGAFIASNGAVIGNFGAVEAMAALILHEFRHWLTFDGGPGHDLRFDSSIYFACFAFNPNRLGNRQPIENSPTAPSGTLTPRPLIGGGGGGTSDIGYLGYGGYPSWWYSTQDFLAWLNSIPVNEGTVTVTACVGSGCNQ